MSMRMLLPVFLLLACFAAGCTPSGTTGPSRFCGTWVSDGYTAAQMTQDGKVVKVNVDQHLRVHIREDGSIDLGFTPIGEMTGADRLRRSGDRVDVPGFGHAEVTSSLTSPTASRLTILVAADSGERTILSLSARLNMRDKMDLEYLASRDQQTERVFATLIRQTSTAPG